MGESRECQARTRRAAGRRRGTTLDAPSIPLWDFSGYSSVTTETLPASGSHAEMEFYWDSSHFKDIVGDFVLD